jgi:hypothetical protein
MLSCHYICQLSAALAGAKFARPVQCSRDLSKIPMPCGKFAWLEQSSHYLCKFSKFCVLFVKIEMARSQDLRKLKMSCAKISEYVRSLLVWWNFVWSTRSSPTCHLCIASNFCKFLLIRKTCAKFTFSVQSTHDGCNTGINLCKVLMAC